MIMKFHAFSCPTDFSFAQRTLKPIASRDFLNGSTTSWTEHCSSIGNQFLECSCIVQLFWIILHEDLPLVLLASLSIVYCLEIEVHKYKGFLLSSFIVLVMSLSPCNQCSWWCYTFDKETWKEIACHSTPSCHNRFSSSGS